MTYGVFEHISVDTVFQKSDIATGLGPDRQRFLFFDVFPLNSLKLVVSGKSASPSDFNQKYILYYFLDKRVDKVGDARAIH